jgi:hypothetical protein
MKAVNRQCRNCEAGVADFFDVGLVAVNGHELAFGPNCGSVFARFNSSS